MKFQQQQQTHSDSSKMNILLILRKSENERSTVESSQQPAGHACFTRSMPL
jgi:hypothetical protein